MNKSQVLSALKDMLLRASQTRDPIDLRDALDAVVIEYSGPHMSISAKLLADAIEEFVKKYQIRPRWKFPARDRCGMK